MIKNGINIHFYFYRAKFLLYWRFLPSFRKDILIKYPNSFRLKTNLSGNITVQNGNWRLFRNHIYVREIGTSANEIYRKWRLLMRWTPSHITHNKSIFCHMLLILITRLTRLDCFVAAVILHFFYNTDE